MGWEPGAPACLAVGGGVPAFLCGPRGSVGAAQLLDGVLDVPVRGAEVERLAERGERDTRVGEAVGSAVCDRGARCLGDGLLLVHGSGKSSLVWSGLSRLPSPPRPLP